MVFALAHGMDASAVTILLLLPNSEWSAADWMSGWSWWYCSWHKVNAHKPRWWLECKGPAQAESWQCCIDHYPELHAEMLWQDKCLSSAYLSGKTELGQWTCYIGYFRLIKLISLVLMQRISHPLIACRHHAWHRDCVHWSGHLQWLHCMRHFSFHAACLFQKKVEHSLWGLVKSALVIDSQWFPVVGNLSESQDKHIFEWGRWLSFGHHCTLRCWFGLWHGTGWTCCRRGHCQVTLLELGKVYSIPPTWLKMR